MSCTKEVQEPTVESIEIGLAQASRIVLRWGDKYLPYVTFLEAALVEAKAKRAVMDRVREYAKDGTKR